MKKQLLSFIILLISLNLLAQNPEEDKIRTTNFPELRKLINSNIPGAPILSQPQQITGTLQDIRTEKHGLIYPAFYDWNKDGKKDLLLGEFETGNNHSYIKVYLNEGTDENPVYSGEYFYATDINGDTIANHQWCCIGIHPRLVDLDGDGYLDIVSGQYNPGLISWWRGSEKGFLPRQFIDQEGYEEGVSMMGSSDPLSPKSFNYWNYTTVDFADFDGDGLLDLFVGGSGGLRVALNIGTKENPKFGLRKYLYHTDGSVLDINKKPDQKSPVVWKTYITPVDWDSDGVLDLLLTYEYSQEGHNAIEFFKGVQTPEGLRFEKPIPLFTEENGHKALPGCQPMITVVDYNNDGIPDIVFGISIPTINGFEVSHEVAWEWAKNLGLQMPGKDPGRIVEWEGGLEKTIERIEREPGMRSYALGKLDDYKYLTMRHRGYVFVMLGSENPTKPSQNPVNFSIKLPEEVKASTEYTAEVTFSFEKGWHGYTDNEGNKALGFIPTLVEFSFPEGIQLSGEISLPEPSRSGLSSVYKGDDNSFKQKFSLSKEYLKHHNELPITIKIQYQVCDENMCMPPEEHTIEKKIKLK